MDLSSDPSTNRNITIANTILSIFSTIIDRGYSVKETLEEEGVCGIQDWKHK